jgi:hypothetical protein
MKQTEYNTCIYGNVTKAPAVSYTYTNHVLIKIF